MRKFMMRAVLAAAFLLACTCSVAQFACTGQYQGTCNSLASPSPAYFSCSFAQQHASNPDQAAAQQMCSGHGGLLKYNRVSSMGGNQCGYTLDHVGCVNAVVCTGQTTAGCNNAPGYVPTDFHDCSYANAHPTSLDLDAATDYCASGNMGLVHVDRLASYSGGQCGYTYDAVHCAPYVSGSLFPKYYILTVMYAPPGCGTQTTPCSSTQNNVVYSQESSNGTATEIEQSTASSVNADVKVGPDDTQVGAGFEATKTTDNTTTETITRSGTAELTVSGEEDGVNHNLDRFVILLNPAISTLAVGPHVTWNMSWRPISGFSPPLNGPYTDTVTVFQLKHPALMPAGIRADFQTIGLTTADYATILAQDPYAYATPSLPPPPRFHETTLSFEYEPPAVADSTICTNGVCNCVSKNGDIKNEFETENVASSDQSYKVSFTTSLGAEDVVVLTAGGDITWDNKSTTTHTTSGKETASATISCPSAGYTGLNHIALYWDTIYGSFLFVPQGPTIGIGTGVGNPIIYQGLVVAHGNPLARQEVELKVGKVTYHTTTNNKGQYAFHSSVIKPKPGQPVNAEVSVGGVHRTVTLGVAEKASIELPGLFTPVKPMNPVKPARESSCLTGQTFVPGRGCVMETRGCPQGSEMREGECVKQAPAPAPYQQQTQEQQTYQKPARVAPGQVLTPTAQAPNAKPIVPAPNYKPAAPAQNDKPTAAVPNAKPTARPIDCRAPLVPNSDGSACVCPQGTTSRGGECLKTPGRAPSPK